MKAFGSLKLCVVLLGLGTLLVFAPSSRAQSEVAPDHFDVGESVQAPVLKIKKSSLPVVSSARTRAASSHTTAHLALGTSSASRQPEVVAVEDKRKTSAGKSN